MEKLPMLDPVGELYVSAFHGQDDDGTNEAARLVTECKQLVRGTKTGRPGRRPLAEDVQRLSPGHNIMITLIQLYFATFESGYRILHQPSFEQEYSTYLAQPAAAPDMFLLQLLLVMAVAAPLHDNHKDIAKSVPAWIDLAQLWLSYSTEKDRLTIGGIQCSCLLLLARQVNRLGSDLVWIAAGSVLRMAIQMGLHQDPDCLPEMKSQHPEIRRRLWYTILEMDAQAALDSGVVPAISADDNSVQLPFPIADDDIDVESTRDVHSSVVQASGKCLFQRELAKHLPLRLRILRTINHLQDKATYEDILALDTSMTAACRQFAAIVAQARDDGDERPTSQFATSFCAHLLHRFSMCLHHPYALRSATSPTYSYSHKICLNETLNFMSLLDDSLYAQVLVKGGGMFRDIVTQGIMTLFLEINFEIEAFGHRFPGARRQSKLEPLMENARRTLQYVRDRTVHGDTNIKSFVILKMMVAQAEARLKNQDQRKAVADALYEGLHESHAILRTISMEANEHSSQSNVVQDNSVSAFVFPSTFGADFGFFDDDFFDLGAGIVGF